MTNEFNERYHLMMKGVKVNWWGFNSRNIS
jgi:hypothetical protein